MADNNNMTQEERQLVVFDLADEAYGVDINAVDGIIRMQVITKVPRTLEFVEGVINLRGEVIPIVDMRKRFGLRVTEETKDSRITVADMGGHKVGMIVDAVNEVLRITADSIEPPSSVITTAESTYLMGIAKVEDRLIILLDLEQVFNDSEKRSLSSTKKKAEDRAAAEAEVQAETATATASASTAEIEAEAEAAPAAAAKKTAAGSKKG